MTGKARRAARCAQMLATGRRCGNPAAAGSRFCHLGSHDGRPHPAPGASAAPYAVPPASAAGRDAEEAGRLFVPAVAEAVAGLPERFAAAGHRVYVVGGAVRDQLIAGEGAAVSAAADVDLATDARPEQTRRALEGWADTVWDLGPKFGTVAAMRGAQRIEVTTFRSEAYDPDSRKPRVEFSSVVAEDLARRDFTVNAIAVDLDGWEVVDPFGGRGDLESGVLRTPLDPEVTFSDDPLRILRAARMAARFGLDPAEGLAEAMGRCAPRLEIVSRERVEEEIDKLLKADRAADGLRMLIDCGAAAEVLPGLTGKDAAAVEAAPAGTGPLVRLAAMLASRGSARIEHELDDWRMSRRKRQEVLGAVRSAERALCCDPGHAPSVRRWAAASGPHAGNGIAVAAVIASQPSQAEQVEALAAAAAAVRDAEPDLSGDVLSGEQIMEHLGCGPGPLVGDAKKHLAETRYDRGPLTEAEAAADLAAWAAARGAAPL